MTFSVMDCDAMLSGRQAATFLKWWYLSIGLRLTGSWTAGYAFVQNNEPQMNRSKETDDNINKYCLLGCNTMYLHFGATCCMPAHLRR